MIDIKTIIPDILSLITCDYQNISCQGYEDIITSCLPERPPYQSLEKPFFIHVSGIPGSGKTTYIDNNPRRNAVRIQFDDIMKKLPDYETVVANEGLAAAFQKFEMPARVLGYELLRRALCKRHNIIFEHSLNPVHIDLYRYLNMNAYDTNLVFMDCLPKEALDRVQEREKSIGRHTPVDFITQRYESAKQLLPAFKELAKSFTILSHPGTYAGQLK